MAAAFLSIVTSEGFKDDGIEEPAQTKIATIPEQKDRVSDLELGFFMMNGWECRA
jgi:hypothetical protein